MLGCLSILLAPPILFVLFIGTLAILNGRVAAPTEFRESILRAAIPPRLSEAITLKVVTFNIQDLYLVGKDRETRMRAIGRRLTALDPDIVGFQEAFVAGDRVILLENLAESRLVHHQYFRSATVGSGLLVASAFPIKEAWFHRYSEAGDWYKVWEGDWWAGKGVGLARIALPGGAYLDFYNTHAQADYGNPAYAVVRKSQMGELASFINESRLATAPALLVGDMNCRVGRPDFEAAVQGAGMLRMMAMESKIDHIFAVGDTAYAYEVAGTERIEERLQLGTHETGLSDHPGYMSTIRIAPAADNEEEERAL